MGRRVFVGTVPGGVGGLNINDGVIAPAEVNGDLTLRPNGTGEIVLSGPTKVPESQVVQFFDQDTSNFVALRAPTTVASNLTYVLPGTDGSSGEFLKTDGSGNLSFGSATISVTLDNTAVGGHTILTVFGSAANISGVTKHNALGYIPSTETLSVTNIGNVTSIETGTLTATGATSSTTHHFTSEFNNGNSGTSRTIDWTRGQKQVVTMTGNCTFGFTAPPGVGNFLLRIVQDATGNRTANWPASVHWVGNTKPTLSTAGNRVDIITFYYNGSIYYGQAGLDFRQA